MLKVIKIAQMTGHNASIFSVGPAIEKDHILSAAGDGWLVQWDLKAPEMGQLIAKVNTQIFSKIHLRKEKKVVLGDMNGGLHWIDLTEPANTKNIAHHQKGVYSFAQIGDFLISGGGDGRLTRWNIKEARSIESLQLSYAAIRSIVFAPERNEIAVGASDHNIYLLNASSLDIVHVYKKAHDNSVFTLHYSPDYNYLISGGRDAQLKVWELEGTRKCISAQSAHWFTINDIVFHPKGHLFATASRDKTIRIWDAHNFSLLKSIETVRDLSLIHI